MKTTYDTRDLGRTLHVRLEGPASFRELLTVIDSIRERAAGYEFVLLDLSEADREPNETTDAILGEHLASALGHLKKLATVAREESITYGSERVLRRRRLNYRVFSNVDEACSWLSRAQ